MDWVTRLQVHLSVLSAHAHVPLNRIWKGDGRPRNMSLVDSLVHFDEQPLSLTLPGSDASASACEVDFFECPGVPLVATLGNESCLRLRLAYERRHFDEAAVERILRHWRNLLEAIAMNPSQPIWQLPMLSAAENTQLTVERNLTGVAFPRELTLHGWFERQVELTPYAIAVSFEGAQLTYDELNRRANQLAHGLRHVGVGPEVLVGLFLDRSMDAVIGILGILKAGGAYLPLDSAFPQSGAVEGIPATSTAGFDGERHVPSVDLRACLEGRPRSEPTAPRISSSVFRAEACAQRGTPGSANVSPIPAPPSASTPSLYRSIQSETMFLLSRGM